MSDFEGWSSGAFPAPGSVDRLVVGDFGKDGDADIHHQTALAHVVQIGVKLPTNAREGLL